MKKLILLLTILFSLSISGQGIAELNKLRQQQINDALVIAPTISEDVFVFDGGATDYFTTAYDINTIDNQTAVVYAKITENTLEKALLGTTTSNTRLWFRYNQGDGGDLEVQLSSGTPSSSISRAWVNDGLYHQFAYTYNGTDLILYIDGVQLGTAQTDADFLGWTDSRLLQIGRRGTTAGSEFNGEMRNVQFYDRALTPSELLSLNADINTTITNKILDYANFDGSKTATTWVEEVGGNNATDAGGVDVLTPVIPSLVQYTTNQAVTSSMIVTQPTDRPINNGDLLMIMTVQDDNAPLIAMAEELVGWRRFIEIGDSVEDVKFGVYYRIADGTESATETITYLDSDDTIGWYLHFENNATQNPISMRGFEGDIGTATTITAPEITTPTNNNLALTVFGYQGGDGVLSITSGTGWADDFLADRLIVQGTATGVQGGFLEKEMPTAGATVDVVFGQTVSDGWNTMQFSIAPLADDTTIVELPYNELQAYYSFEDDGTDFVNDHDMVQSVAAGDALFTDAGFHGTAATGDTGLDGGGLTTPNYYIGADVFTSSFWLRPETNDNAGHYIGNRGAAAADEEWQWLHTGGIAYLAIWDDSANSNIQGRITGNNIMNSHVWHHVVLTKNTGFANTTIEVYIDGVPVVNEYGGTVLSSNIEDSSTGLTLFDPEWTTGNNAAGRIDGLAMWSKGFSADEAKALYLAQLEGELIPSTELTNQNSALSSYAEHNALGFATSSGSTVSVAGVGLADTEVAQDGDYSLKVSQTVNDGFGRVDFDFPVIGGESYEVTFWAKRGSQSTNPYIGSWTNLTGHTEQDILTTTWTEYSFITTATLTGTGTVKAIAGADGSLAGDNIYVDNLTIGHLKEISFGSGEVGDVNAAAWGTNYLYTVAGASEVWSNNGMVDEISIYVVSNSGGNLNIYTGDVTGVFPHVNNDDFVFDSYTEKASLDVTGKGSNQWVTFTAPTDFASFYVSKGEHLGFNSSASTFGRHASPTGDEGYLFASTAPPYTTDLNMSASFTRKLMLNAKGYREDRDTYYLNFGVLASGLANWNDISSNVVGTSVLNIVDSDAVASTIDVEITAATGASSNGGTFAYTVPWIANDNIASSYYYFTASGVTWEISGLDDSKTYTFEFYNNREPFADNRNTEYTVTGTNSDVVELQAVNNYSNTITTSAISPSSGIITLSGALGTGNDSGNGYINAVKITQYN